MIRKKKQIESKRLEPYTPSEPMPKLKIRSDTYGPKKKHSTSKSIIIVGGLITILGLGIYTNIKRNKLKYIDLQKRIEETLKYSKKQINPTLPEIVYLNVGDKYNLIALKEQKSESSLIKKSNKPKSNELNLTTILEKYDEIVNANEKISELNIYGQNFPILHLDLDRDNKLKNIIYLGNGLYIVDNKTLNNVKKNYSEFDIKTYINLRIGNRRFKNFVYGQDNSSVINGATLATIAVNNCLNANYLGLENKPIGSKKETFKAFDLILSNKGNYSKNFKENMEKRVTELSKTGVVFTFK